MPFENLKTWWWIFTHPLVMLLDDVPAHKRSCISAQWTLWHITRKLDPADTCPCLVSTLTWRKPDWPATMWLKSAWVTRTAIATTLMVCVCGLQFWYSSYYRRRKRILKSSTSITNPGQTDGTATLRLTRT